MECSQALRDSPRRHKGVSLGNLSTLLVQVAHHLAIHVRAQLGGVVDVGDHDGLGSDDQAQAQSLEQRKRSSLEQQSNGHIMAIVFFSKQHIKTKLSICFGTGWIEVGKHQ